MSPTEFIRHFGGVTRAAAALNIKQPSVSEWVKADRIPIDRQCQIEVITGGALRADRAALTVPTRADDKSAGAPTLADEAGAPIG